MVKELHKLGFGKLHIVPSLSPSGMHWRCSFVSESKRGSFNASNWIYEKENAEHGNEIKSTVEELTNVFVEEHHEFLEHCKGMNTEYETWYSEMLGQLQKDELPYAFAEYFSPSDFWKTSKDNTIKTLPGEQRYYF